MLRSDPASNCANIKKNSPYQRMEAGSELRNIEMRFDYASTSSRHPALQLRLTPEIRDALSLAERRRDPVSLRQEHSQATLTIGERAFLFTATEEEGICDVIQLPSDSSAPTSTCTVLGSIKQKLTTQVRETVCVHVRPCVHAHANRGP